MGNDIGSTMIKIFFYGLIALVLVLTGVQSYWVHDAESRRHAKIDSFLNDPTARPKAWTSDQDDVRSRDFCKAILLLAAESLDSDAILLILPDICDAKNSADSQL